jgi:hypothetical protein
MDDMSRGRCSQNCGPRPDLTSVPSASALMQVRFSMPISEGCCAYAVRYIRVVLMHHKLSEFAKPTVVSSPYLTSVVAVPQRNETRNQHTTNKQGRTETQLMPSPSPSPQVLDDNQAPSKPRAHLPSQLQAARAPICFQGKDYPPGRRRWLDGADTSFCWYRTACYYDWEGSRDEAVGAARRMFAAGDVSGTGQGP